MTIEPPKTAPDLSSLQIPDGLPRIVIEKRSGWAAFDLKELWAYRDLLWVLVGREIKLRYKQTGMGVAWALLQPLLAGLIFGALVYFARLPSGGLPVMLYVFSGLVPWMFFSGAVQRGGTSLVSNTQLITKIYFPRLLIPLSNTLAALLDWLVTMILLVVLMIYYRQAPGLSLLALPFFVLFLILAATGISLWVSALSVRYRDFVYVIPFVMQIWMYASPIIFPVRLIPAKYLFFYNLNPMVGLIEGFRWSVFGHSSLTFQMFAVSTFTSIFLFVSGAVFFRRVERTFADII